jgi:beta-mannosidase
MVTLSNWKIQSFVPDLVVSHPDYIDHFWMSAKVPGDVHSTLIDKKVIEHPFFGHNDLKCRWIEEKVWWYRTEFHLEDRSSIHTCMNRRFPCFARERWTFRK